MTGRFPPIRRAVREASRTGSAAVYTRYLEAFRQSYLGLADVFRLLAAAGLPGATPPSAEAFS